MPLYTPSSFTFNISTDSSYYINTNTTTNTTGSYYLQDLIYHYQAIPITPPPDPNWIEAGDWVSTPEGDGQVWLIDENDTICVEIHKDSGIVYEFDRSEITKIVKKGR